MVNKTVFKSNTFRSAVRIASEGDPILLIEDGVYSVRPGGESEALVKEVLGKHSIYALAPDLKARGIDVIIEGIEQIDYHGFVELAEKHQVITWT
jgi:tRNA 2-thiouridine synthesizing protein B